MELSNNHLEKTKLILEEANEILAIFTSISRKLKL